MKWVLVFLWTCEWRILDFLPFWLVTPKVRAKRLVAQAKYLKEKSEELHEEIVGECPNDSKLIADSQSTIDELRRTIAMGKDKLHFYD